MAESSDYLSDSERETDNIPLEYTKKRLTSEQEKELNYLMQPIFSQINEQILEHSVSKAFKRNLRKSLVAGEKILEEALTKMVKEHLENTLNALSVDVLSEGEIFDKRKMLCRAKPNYSIFTSHYKAIEEPMQGIPSESTKIVHEMQRKLLAAQERIDTVNIEKEIEFNIMMNLMRQMKNFQNDELRKKQEEIGNLNKKQDSRSSKVGERKRDSLALLEKKVSTLERIFAEPPEHEIGIEKGTRRPEVEGNK